MSGAGAGIGLTAALTAAALWCAPAASGADSGPPAGSVTSSSSSSSSPTLPVTGSGTAADLPGSVTSSLGAYGPAASVAGSAGSAGSGSLGPTVRTGPADAAVGEYVALGDSYSSVGRVLPGHWAGGPPQCLRTADAYPGVVAAGLRPARFVNATCAGGVIENLWSPRFDGVPAQFDALGPETDVVTVSIGGNDVGFADVVLSCVLPPPFGAGGGSTAGSVRQAGAESVAGAAGSILPPTSTDLSVTGSTHPSTRTEPPGPVDGDDDEAGVPGSLVTGSLDAIGTVHDCRTLLEDEMPGRLIALSAELDAVHAEIRRRAPDAVVVATGYPALLPSDGTTCPMLDTIPPGLVPVIAAFERALDRTVAEAAVHNGALAAAVTDPPGHDVCAPPSERWVDVLGGATGAGPVHPTRAGQAHVAAEVLAVLADRGPDRAGARITDVTGGDGA